MVAFKKTAHIRSEQQPQNGLELLQSLTSKALLLFDPSSGSLEDPNCLLGPKEINHKI